MAGSFPPAILLAGDLFLIEERYKTLLKDFQSKIKGEIHTQSFKLTDTPLDSVLAEARTLPFLASFQVLRVQEAQSLKEKKQEPLANYLESPNANTVLILEAVELEKDSALAKLAGKKGQVFFLEDSEKKVAGAKLVREKLRRAGKTFAPGALERLEEQAGDAPAFIDSVIDQLILYMGDKTEITEDIVETFQENWKEPNIFTLTDAIVTRRRKEALVCLQQILEQGEKEIIPLIGMLHWQIRRFWQAKVLLEDGVSQNEIFKKCKIYPKQAPFFLRQLQALTRKKLEQALEGLFQLDWGLKTGRSEGAVDLEKWVVQLTS